MAYESPIRLVTEIENKIIEDQTEGIYKAVLSYRIDISKDELFKLLYGDRKQYDKGYSDGRADAIKHGRWSRERLPSTDGGSYEVFRCNLCNEAFNWRTAYCPNCGAKMDEVEENV